MIGKFRKSLHRLSCPHVEMWVLSVAALVLAVPCFAAAPTGMQKDIVFQDYSPLASDAELAERLFRPLLARRLLDKLAATGRQAGAQSVDLARERFSLYVPADTPPSGRYGLLVWISPADPAEIPASWRSVLDRQGVICVTAAGSGNSANLFSRRIPLALLGYANVAKDYPVDPARTYIGGLSGGSRVALRIALAFPDVFHGALLNAGSDSFGTAVLPPPKAELFRQFEEQTRLIYVTGSRDEEHLVMDAHSRESARELCITDMQTDEMYGRGHELLDAAALGRALAELSAPRKVDSRLAVCRDRRTREIEARANEIDALIGAGDKHEAQDKLRALDERYGGLAAPRSVELENRL
jgi:hypothetical protein